MFKLQPNPSFKSKVALSVPGSDKQITVGITFKHLSRPQIKDFFSHLDGKTDAEALGEVIIDWEDIDASFTPDNLSALLDNYPTAGGELFDAFRRDLLESRRKN